MCHYYIARSFARSYTFFIIFEKNAFFNVLYSYFSRSLHLWLRRQSWIVVLMCSTSDLHDVGWDGGEDGTRRPTPDLDQSLHNSISNEWSTESVAWHPCAWQSTRRRVWPDTLSGRWEDAIVLSRCTRNEIQRSTEQNKLTLGRPKRGVSCPIPVPDRMFVHCFVVDQKSVMPFVYERRAIQRFSLSSLQTPRKITPF